ncbi:MAG: rubrerythrin family protein [Thermococci archaeon]|nr:rubrerythrin family protein [Thermococci archaeon]
MSRRGDGNGSNDGDGKEEMLKTALDFYIDEHSDAFLYSKLAEGGKDPEVRRELERLASIEEGHARFWREFLERHGVSVPRPRIRRLSVMSVRALRKLLGPGAVVSLLEMGENTAVKKYFRYLTTYSDELSEEERRTIKTVVLDELEHEKVFQSEKKRFHVENVRDLILGMNDGLVEILGAVTGLSAVYPNDPRMVGVSGLIVGVAGALSMAIGTFVSVRSQRQVNESLRERMEVLFRVSPEKAKEELLNRLVEGGMPESVASETVERLTSEAIMKLVIPEESENEVRSALYTGLAYLLGVAFPVSPYFFVSSSLIALPLSVVLAGSALAMVAALVSMLSGISVKKKVAEMVLTGLGAAFLSYLFGSFIDLLK